MNHHFDAIERMDGIVLLSSDEMRAIAGGSCAGMCNYGYFNCLRAGASHDTCWQSENFCLGGCPTRPQV
jgi:hypothetical protein